MPWEAWVLIGWFVLNLVLQIAYVGRQIKVTSGSAVFSLVVYTFSIWCVVRLVASA